MIKIENVNCEYNKEYIFKNINLEIQNGDYVVIIGENGSGKTTLIKMLLGIQKCYEGNIEYDNINIKNFHNWTEIGYVPQSFTISHDIPITVEEYLNMYSNDKKKIEKNIQNFKLTKIKKKLINKLSGGQLQRVNIVKSLLSNIKYLIMDEPTTGLDIESREELYSTLHKLNQKGLTIIVISHNVLEFKDKIHKIFNIETRQLMEVNKNDCKYC